MKVYCLNTGPLRGGINSSETCFLDSSKRFSDDAVWMVFRQCLNAFRHCLNAFSDCQTVLSDCQTVLSDCQTVLSDCQTVNFHRSSVGKTPTTNSGSIEIVDDGPMLQFSSCCEQETMVAIPAQILAMIVTPDDMMQKGLEHWGLSKSQINSAGPALKLGRFKSWFGSHPIVCAQIWEDLLTTEIFEARILPTDNLDHYFVALYFLKAYGRKEKEEERKAREALGRANSTLTTFSSVILNILL